MLKDKLQSCNTNSKTAEQIQIHMYVSYNALKVMVTSDNIDFCGIHDKE